MIYVVLVAYLVLIICLSSQHSNLEHDFDRKLPKESSTICMYYFNSKFTGKEFWITLLELIDKEFYKLENINGTRYLAWNRNNMFDLDQLGLKAYEKKVVLFVNGIIYEDNRKSKIEFEELKEKIKVSNNLQKWMESYYVLLKEEISKTHGLISPDNRHTKVFFINLFYMLIAAYNIAGLTPLSIVISVLMAAAAEIMANVFVNTKNKFKAVISIFLLIFVPVMALVLSIASTAFIYILIYGQLNLEGTIMLFIKSLYPLLILADVILLKKTTSRRNIEQQKLYDNLLSLKNFMVEFTLTNQRPIDYINFLDKYYVLAVALGVNVKHPNYIESDYNDDTIHTFDADDLIRNLEDGSMLF